MKKDLTRRDFVKVAGLGAGAVMLPSLSGCGWMQQSAGAGGAGSAGWERVPEILARIRAPQIPERRFDVTNYGARGDGQADCTAALAAAIAACNAAGGGHVVVPAGRFVTGPIHLRSNVDLHVSAGATIAFKQDPNAYLPPVMTRWEGVELMGYSPLVYAIDQENISITGEGTLDGGGDATHWWPWKGGTWGKGPNQAAARAKLIEMAEAGTPPAQRVFGDGSYLRPQFIQPYRCRNVLISGVRIVNSPMWEIHPVLCTNVIVRNVTIDTHGPNNDGCNPESCRDVLIEGCSFDTGDDCIAIKSGRNADGRRIATPTENVIIRNCRMKDGHGGVTIGSEISGGVRWVFTEKCEMDSPNLERALRFKNNAMRGGLLEHVYMRDVTIGQVSDSVLSMDLYYEEGQQGPFTPVIRDVEMRNVTSRKSKFALYMRAYERSEISDVRIVHCDFAGVERGNITQGVQRLQFEDVRINGQPAGPRSHEVPPPPDSEKLPSDLRKPPPARQS